jgi:hypothetical protein
MKKKWVSSYSLYHVKSLANISSADKLTKLELGRAVSELGSSLA